jgi:single-strand DNA-binding protein
MGERRAGLQVPYPVTVPRRGDVPAVVRLLGTDRAGSSRAGPTGFRGLWTNERHPQGARFPCPISGRGSHSHGAIRPAALGPGGTHMIDSALTLVGSLIETPEPRTTTSGLTVTSFRLACTPRRFDRAQTRWVDCPTVFITVTCWRQLAENVVGSLRRGDRVLVAGRLRQRVYQQEDGTRRASIEIDADAIGPDLGRHAVHVRRPAREPVPIPPGGRPAAPLPPAGPLVHAAASGESGGDRSGDRGTADTGTPPPAPVPSLTTEASPDTERSPEPVPSGAPGDAPGS